MHLPSHAFTTSTTRPAKFWEKMRFLLISGLAAIISGANALTSTLRQVTNFGTNPSGAGMYIYVPTKLAVNPPIIVAIHYCTGTGQAYFQGTQWANQVREILNSAGINKCPIIIYQSAGRRSWFHRRLPLFPSLWGMLGCRVQGFPYPQWWIGFVGDCKYG